MNGSVGQRYLHRYPRAGHVALLCEGDLAGYEVSVLERWTGARTQPKGVFVDVWPCGTADSLYGMADALGRARPIVVIEDRDYRQPQVAKEECDRKRGDREQRGIRVLTWRTWRRHEIENYFLEPAILFPVMAEAFGTTEGEVEQRFHRLVSILAVDQAAQYAIYHMRHPWTDQNLPGRLPPGIPGKEARPRWDPQQNSVVAPAKNEVERHLETAIDKGQEALKEAGSRMRPDDAIRAFHDKCEQWAELEAHRPEWRVDWAGKEILAHMRQWLAAEYGWPDTESGTRERVDWDSMTRSQRGEQERAIERGLQPRLVHKFLALLSNPSSADHWENEIRQEWHAVAEICAAKP